MKEIFQIYLVTALLRNMLLSMAMTRTKQLPLSGMEKL